MRDRRTMSQTALRRMLLGSLTVIACLTATWAVRAATNPKLTSASNASSYTPTAGAAYTAAIKVSGPTTSFHNSVAARYNYAFGKDSPFLPSNATSVNGQFLSPKAFYTAEYCGHCHKEAYHQWRQSVHANSFR